MIISKKTLTNYFKLQIRTKFEKIEFFGNFG